MTSPESAVPPNASPSRAGRLRRLFGRFHVHGVFWYRLHLFAIRHIPTLAYYLLVPLFSTFFFFGLPRIRRAVAANFDVALGPCGFWHRQWRVWRNLHVYSWCMTERYEDLVTDRRVEPGVEGLEFWQEACRLDEGVVLVTAHIGHWEVASAFPSDLQGRQIHVVREGEIDPAAQDLFRGLIEARSRQGYTVHFARRAGDLGPKLLLALRDGDMVALQGDRPARQGRTIETRFFGRPFHVPVGPAAMTRAAGVAMLPVFNYRAGRLRSTLLFRPLIRVEKTSDRDHDLQRVVDHIMAEVEQAILRNPYQWFCFTELWPDEPEASHV